MGETFYHPLDPDCEAVRDAMKLRDDPKVTVGKFVWASFERVHRVICERCQRYGAAHVRVRD